MTRAQRWTLLAAVVASGIVFLDSTVVNLALKRIGEELPRVTAIGVLEGQAYVGSGYLAVLAALLIIAGALADRYGRRRIFIIGLAAFGVISVLCGIAPSLEFLIVARLLQGAAGALLVPISLAIITAAFSGAARARAFGLWAASTSAMTLLCPILMAIRPHPLVPLSLFRNREFAAINLATILIYGALYVSFSYTAMLFQGTLGYSATGAAVIGIPAGVLLAVLSARFGALTGRYGARRFLVTGPLIVALGFLWLARIPADSAPWHADLANPATWIPPLDALIDVLPASIA